MTRAAVLACALALGACGKSRQKRAGDGGARPAEYEVLDTLVEQNRSVSKGYQAASMPSAVLIRPDGTIGSPIAIGEAAIGNLIEWATAR